MTSESSALRVLVFAPHPDDDIIGCGGSIIKHLERGNEVIVIYVTDGAVECPQFMLTDFIKLRKKETLNAAKHLGLEEKNLFFLGQKPWHLNPEKLREIFLSLIRQIRPDVCYIPHAADGHTDHRVVSQEALDAINMAPSPWFRPYGSKMEEPFSISTILAYEVWSPLTAPNYFEDISLVVEKKMAALREHRSQEVKKYECAYRGINAFRGAMHEGEEYASAEAFQILKCSKIF